MKKEIIRFMRKFVSTINPILATKIMYKSRMHKKLNFKNPQTFNEKINWLKTYEYPKNKEIIQCADKYEVRSYLEDKGLSKYLVGLIGVWDSVDDIDFDKLPNQFVLKCNHGSGYNIICKDKKTFDLAKAKAKLRKWMKEDFGKVSGERHYSTINKKILCEEYLGNELVDLQFWCFNGKIEFISYIKNPHGDNNKKSFNTKWEELNFVTSLPDYDKKVAKPRELKKMIEIAENLSKHFKFLRFDWYILEDNSIKISEMTFTPASGFVNWYPEVYDKIMGEKLSLKK